MKSLLFVFALGIAFNVHAQSIVGKWKPVSFAVDPIMTANVTDGGFHIDTAALKNLVKDDKDPEKSFKMMDAMLVSFFEVSQQQVLTFAANGNWTDYQTRSKKMKTGVYTLDKDQKKVTMRATKDQKASGLDISWKNGHLVLTTNMFNEQKLGAMTIEYEPVK